MDSVMVSVKIVPLQTLGNSSDNSSTFPVSIVSSKTGCELRTAVARLSGQSPDDIRLIFAGKLINDAHTIQDLDITENTTIHAVRVPGNSTTLKDIGELETSEQTAHTNITHFSNQDEFGRPSLEEPELRPRFYVYCKRHCQSVHPGKLRVCCGACSDHAFVVSEDPDCWEDVLIPGRVAGKCLAQECPGSKAKFYFKCTSHDASVDDNVIPLPLLKTNTRRVMCITCADVLNPVLVFRCQASHVVCLECFSQYCRLCLDERRFHHTPTLGYTLPCPARCEDSLIRDTHHFLVMGKEQYERYKRFGAEECLLQEGGVLCPAPGCGAGILPDDDERIVVCRRGGGFGCGFVFCRNCHEANHEGECGQWSEQPQGQGSLSGDVDLERARRARWEREESRRTIDRTSKPCPKCKVPIERSGGCMHMTCSRTQCKYEWCWLCETEWNRTCMQDHWFGLGPEILW